MSTTLPIAWFGMSLLASGIMAAAYFVFSRLIENPASRFLLLKLLFLGLPLVPIWTLIDSPSESSKLTGQSTLPDSSYRNAPRITDPSPHADGLYRISVLIVLVYAVGVLFLLLRFIRSLMAIADMLKNSYRSGRFAGHEIWVHDGDASPAAIGILHPKILIPAWLLDQQTREDLAMIYQHESVHIKRLDHIYNHYRHILRILFWHSPFFHYLFHEFESEMELSCDAEVLRSGVKPKTYGNLLLSLTERLVPDAHPVRSSISMSRTSISRRIIAMQKRSRKVSRTLPFITFALVFGVAGWAVASANVYENVQTFTTSPQEGEFHLSYTLDVKTFDGRQISQEIDVFLEYGQELERDFGPYVLKVVGYETDDGITLKYKLIRDGGRLGFRFRTSLGSEEEIEEEYDENEMNIHKLRLAFTVE